MNPLSVLFLDESINYTKAVVQYFVFGKYPAQGKVYNEAYCHIRNSTYTFIYLHIVPSPYFLNLFTEFCTVSCPHCLSYHLRSLIMTSCYKASFYGARWGEDGFGLNGYGGF